MATLNSSLLEMTGTLVYKRDVEKNAAGTRSLVLEYISLNTTQMEVYILCRAFNVMLTNKKKKKMVVGVKTSSFRI